MLSYPPTERDEEPDIAHAFNSVYGNVFTVPTGVVDANVATIPGIDGRKMSKSYDNVVPIFADRNEVARRVMAIRTDSRRPDEPKDPDTCRLFALFRHLGPVDDVDQLAVAYRAGGVSYRERQGTDNREPSTPLHSGRRTLPRTARRREPPAVCAQRWRIGRPWVGTTAARRRPHGVRPLLSSTPPSHVLRRRRSRSGGRGGRRHGRRPTIRWGRCSRSRPPNHRWVHTIGARVAWRRADHATIFVARLVDASQGLASRAQSHSSLVRRTVFRSAASCLASWVSPAPGNPHVE